MFEGRPNVFADACGVIRGGNTVVFRIGSDALGTARAIVRHALDPALAEAGLPPGAASLVESAEHASAWAMFSDRRVALAVARGSGAAVAQLGAVARQAGAPVSLHGTRRSLDRRGRHRRRHPLRRRRAQLTRPKVCNTLGVCCIVRSRAAELMPLFLAGLEEAGRRRGHGCRLHVIEGDEDVLPEAWRTARAVVRRAEGDVEEPLTESLPLADIGREWEWEETPEVTLHIVESADEAVALFNRYSPQFVAALISEDAAAHQRFYETINAPFVGDGMTRWVDGQFALSRPELGLTNWEKPPLRRGGVLSGTACSPSRRARQTMRASRWPKT